MIAWFRRRHEGADRRVLEAIRQGAGHGLDIASAAGMRYSRVMLSLYRLEVSGQITSRWEDRPGGWRRRLYSVAEPGGGS